MREFNFRLQKILDIRSWREREAELEVGRRLGILVGIENNIKSVACETVSANGNRFSAQNGARDIIAWNNYIFRLEKTTERLLADAATAELAVEEARAAYFDASRERKIIDKLKEKQKAYEKEQRKKEADATDGMVNARKAREMMLG
jgi:flagellar FliJ protein